MWNRSRYNRLQPKQSTVKALNEPNAWSPGQMKWVRHDSNVHNSQPGKHRKSLKCNPVEPTRIVTTIMNNASGGP